MKFCNVFLQIHNIHVYKPAHFSVIFSPHIILTSSHLSARKGQQINIFSNDKFIIYKQIIKYSCEIISFKSPH